MKILILTILVVANLASAQSAYKISLIRKTVEATNNYSGYKIKTLDNDYFTDEKNEVTDNGH